MGLARRRTNYLDLVCAHFDGPAVIVDVGAAGEFKDLSRIARRSELHLIEPRARSVTEPVSPYAAVHRHELALAGETGERTLHVTANAYASSMLRPNPTVVERWQLDHVFRVIGEERLACITLDEFARRSGLQQIDYLKIDTQGTELEILRGGARILDRTSIIRTEAEFVELYQGQPLYDEIVGDMRERGFRFVDFYDGETFGARGRPKRIWADALFVRRDLRGDQLLKAAAILMELGYWTDALWMMKDGGADPALINGIAVPRNAGRGVYPRTIKNLARFLLGRALAS